MSLLYSNIALDCAGLQLWLELARTFPALQQLGNPLHCAQQAKAKSPGSLQPQQKLLPVSCCCDDLQLWLELARTFLALQQLGDVRYCVQQAGSKCLF